MKKREKKREVFLDGPDHVLISSLKGRVSKILNISSRLSTEELESLILIYNAIDDLILDKKDSPTIYLYALTRSSQVLGKSTRPYIKKHILPLINKISTKKWG